MPSIDRLLEIMARLRDPQRGCPWDLEQSFGTIAPYTIEEAYEVADAIERKDYAGVARRARRPVVPGRVPCADGARAGRVRLRRRGRRDLRQDGAAPSACVRRRARSTDARGADRRVGRAEAAASASAPATSVLADVPVALPALTRANKLGKRAAQVGFEWPDVGGRARQARRGARRAAQGTRREQAGQARIADELGDVLFCVVNVCRYLEDGSGNGAEAARTRSSSGASATSSSACASRAATPSEATLEEMDELWDEGKKRERDSGSRAVTKRLVASAITSVTTSSASIQGSFMPFRLLCLPGSAHIQPGFGEHRCVRLVVCWCWRGVFGVTGVALAAPPPWSNSRHESPDSDYDYAPVTHVEPIVRQVRIETPRRECYDDVRYVESRRIFPIRKSAAARCSAASSVA